METRLQGIGIVEAQPASEVKVGDVRAYNFGATGLVIKVIEKSAKTLTLITFESGKYHMFDIRKTSPIVILKRDQDVSMHQPKEVSVRHKGMVDVSEYFQTEEVKEEISVEAPEQTDEIQEENKVSEQPTEKIEVESITFNWSESNQVNENTLVATFEEAEQIIYNIASHKNSGGYDKTSFTIKWVDGHTYTGRIDVLSNYTSGKELKKHIENHCLFFAGEKRNGYSVEDYENTLRAYGVTEEQKQEFKDFLAFYMLEDTVKAEEIKQEEVVSGITYSLNKEKNGVEIYFTEKPSEEVRETLKANKFRWSRTNKYWYAKQTEDTISLAKQLAGDGEAVYNSQTKTEPTSYPEVEIDDCRDEKYNIPQSIIDREHDANWIFRTSKRDHNKDLQDTFIHYTDLVRNTVTELNNSYYEYKLKEALQRFKKQYHELTVKYLSAKGSQPSWAVSGRGNLNVSKYNKGIDRQNTIMFELADLPKEFEKKINYYKNKVKKAKENELKNQLQEEIKQPLDDVAFKTVTKDFDIYGRGTAVKTRFYECEGYSTAKLWGAFRVFDQKGKEIWSAKSNGTLKDAKAYISLLIRKQRQAAS